jgi:hypothetical protein
MSLLIAKVIDDVESKIVLPGVVELGSHGRVDWRLLMQYKSNRRQSS